MQPFFYIYVGITAYEDLFIRKGARTALVHIDECLIKVGYETLSSQSIGRMPHKSRL